MYVYQVQKGVYDMKTIITIGRQAGSGGKEIGQKRGSCREGSM